MAEYTFQRSLSGKLNGEPFPKVGETREVPDSLVEPLKRMKFISDEGPADLVPGANVSVPPTEPVGDQDKGKVDTDKLASDESDAALPETAATRERATVEAPETADANTTPAVKPGDKPEGEKPSKPSRD